MPQLLKKKIITYGINPQADLQAVDIVAKENTTTFTVVRDNKELGTIKLLVPGFHNVRNALAAIAVGIELKVPFSQVKAGLEKFSGVYRRWELKAEVNGISVYDDYAHHPTEIKASLQGVKAGWKRRVVCVFQPHLYSRTRDFADEFGRSFFIADILIVTNVYPAREEPIQGVSGMLITEAAHRFGHKEVHYVPDKTKIPEYLMSIVRKNDIVITMGAGDIWKYGEEFIQRLTGKK
jgi:UDP-N-acetylmuramate--alanine ligase